MAPIGSAFVQDRFAAAIEGASQRFTNQIGYERTVIEGVASGPVNATGPAHPSKRGIVFGCLANGAALAVACFGLFKGPLTNKTHGCCSR